MLSRRLRYSLLLLLLPLALSAQKKEQQDSLVRLLGCDKLQLEDIGGHSYRKALGHARFEHNSTKLLCDTALWNVDADVIQAMGHVRIIQNNTVLSSDKLNYYIGSSQAEFRGSLVQLQDKQKNTLRTKNLDYNTKDSVAVFRNGGSFRDKDGQIIESDVGVYDSKIKLFRFSRNVNMYTDSVFVKTDRLDYNTETSVAVFGTGTNAWKGNNMLSSEAGSYERAIELFTFTNRVHLLTTNQEAWADTLVYDRAFDNTEMRGHVELLDTTRNLTAIAGFMEYLDSIEQIRMQRDPAVIASFEQDGTMDTVYVRADFIRYRAIPRNHVSDNEIAKSETRMKDLQVDPIAEYRRKAYEAAKAAAEEAKKKMEEEDPNIANALKGKARAKGKAGGTAKPPAEEAPPEQPDSGDDQESTQEDDAGGQPPEVVDSSKVGFLYGLHNVKVFRKDMQVVCDSLEYNDLDSLVRLYQDPIVWNEIRRQYRADSITVVLKNNALDKASLMSNAFIVIQEDSICFDQIKGAEMMAFFDSTGALRRFDSMGGASGLFFLEEKGAFATVNKFEAKMLTATFSNASIDDLNYYEEVKSDAYPAVQLRKDERILKGFEWQPEKRPKGPEDVVSYTPRKSQRARYESIPHAQFVQTELYFPGHIDHINKMLASADSLKRARRAEQELQEEMRRLEEAQKAQETQEDQEAQEDEKVQEAQEDQGQQEAQEEEAAQNEQNKQEEQGLQAELVNEPEQPAENPDTVSVSANDLAAAADSLGMDAAMADSLAVRDSLAAIADSLARVKFIADSIRTARMDSLRKVYAADPLDMQKALKKAEREAKKAAQDSLRQEKAARKEAKWAALDARDAEKAAKKEAKRAAKRKVQLEKMLKAKQAREAREQKILDRYKARFEKKKARKDAAALKKEERKKEKS